MKAVCLALGVAMFIFLFLGLPTPAFETNVIPTIPPHNSLSTRAQPVNGPTLPAQAAPQTSLSASPNLNVAELRQLAALSALLQQQANGLNSRLRILGCRNRTFLAGRSYHLTNGLARR